MLVDVVPGPAQVDEQVLGSAARRGGPRRLRRRLISYSATPAATPAFRDSTPALIGIAATVSQASRTSRDSPVSSLPTTSTSGPDTSSTWSIV